MAGGGGGNGGGGNGDGDDADLEGRGGARGGGEDSVAELSRYGASASASASASAGPNVKDRAAETDSLLIKRGDDKDDKDDKDDPDRTATPLRDAADTLRLAFPIFVAMASWVGMKTTDTALLGHVGADALSAAALSDLWTMCTGVLIQGRVLGILVGQAVGAGNPRLAGVYLQVSLVVLSFVSVFVIAAWLCTERFWTAFGEGQDVSRNAGLYSSILSLSVPATLAKGQLAQFFQAQRIMRPEVVASSFALLLNLLLGLLLVLGVGLPRFDGWGFPACPTVTVVAVYVQLFVLWFVFCHVKGLHRPCWGGWSWPDITKERVRTYSEIYFPAALGSASDFWRMGVIGAIAAKLGDLEVAVFNTSYRVIWISLILTSATAGAAGIKMSLRLGRGMPWQARQAGFVGIAVSFFLLLIIALAVGGQTRLFGRIFTSDEDFLDMFDGCSVPFVATLFLMNLAVAIERIPYSMGRTKEVFWMGFIASWGGQVPGVFLLIRYWRDDLVGLYTGMAIGYFVLCVLYGIITFTSDWVKYSEIAIQRSEKKS